MKPTPTLGVYSLAQAARLTALSSQTLASWFGRNRGSAATAMLKPDFRPLGRRVSISFLDLIDVQIATQLRRGGPSLREIKAAFCRLSSWYEERHPFARADILARISYNKENEIVVDRSADIDGSKLVNPRKRQLMMPAILRPFLKHIVFDRDLKAASWELYDGVVLSPVVNIGKPTLKNRRVATYLVAARFATIGDPGTVAQWYDLRPEEVTRAVEFEAWLRAGRRAA